jgi:hypothetical protein
LIGKIEWNCDKSLLGKKVGDEKQSALKLTILLQELFLEAITSATIFDTCKKENRIFSVAIQDISYKFISIEIFYSYKKDTDSIDNKIVGNFLETFDPKHEETFDENTNIKMKSFKLQYALEVQ